MSDELARLRARIDGLDDELLRLLNERAAAARAIGRLKDGVAYRPERGWGFSHGPAGGPASATNELDDLRRRVAELESKLGTGGA